MLISGVVSVTFRKLTPGAVVAAAARAGLEGIEWGGDVHVPHGDIAKAREVRSMTEEAGLRVSSYGSYYSVGAADGLPFERVIETALALGTSTVRVWAGKKGSAASDADHWKMIADETDRIAAIARVAGISIAFEYHGGTLTDSRGSVKRLLAACPQDNVRMYWQIVVGDSAAETAAALTAVLPRLSNLHVFWVVKNGDASDRRPLAEGRAAWRTLFPVASPTDRERWALLEFVRGDDPAQLVLDAAVLKELLAAANATISKPTAGGR